MRNKTQRNAQSPSLLFVRRNCHAQETPHCHVRKEPLPRTLPRQKETLPRTRHHTATSKRNPATHKTPHCHIKKKPCHAQDTTLPRQKGTPATHKTPHCHVRKEPLPRTRHHTATSERNPCHSRPRLCNWKKTIWKPKKKHLVVTKKHYKKHVLRPKKSREQHLTDWKCTWQNSSATRGRPMLPHMSASQHQSRIGECQILRVGPFFMVEDLANVSSYQKSPCDFHG